MKRSKEVALVLIATASLVACGPDTQSTRREYYASREKCQEDWGSDKCDEDPQRGIYTGPHYFYYGGHPYYFPRGSDTPVQAGSGMRISALSEGMRSANTLGTVSDSHIVRGGFGKSSFSHGGGS